MGKVWSMWASCPTNASCPRPRISPKAATPCYLKRQSLPGWNSTQLRQENCFPTSGRRIERPDVQAELENGQGVVVWVANWGAGRRLLVALRYPPLVACRGVAAG